MSVSRRDVLKTLSVGAAAGSVLQTIPTQAAEYVHHMISTEKATSKTGAYTPKYFKPQQYKTVQSLCESIFPADADCGGAIEAGAPEYIDLLTSENPHYQLTLGGGIMWLDSTCIDRYGKTYLDCTKQQQTEMLDKIAYRKSGEEDPSLSQGVEFFSFLRNLAADGFFTSQIGIKYLGYIGNTYLAEFPGCPPVPGV
ncbi:MAG TPA: gluconate 2-dehydrogenase subunit 3 family protein [Acidobacteriaceae bacterium]|nr:gluconate 2-dehydrogenase subunit 3 family protein [Acidobacteriaceae bacterium]